MVPASNLSSVIVNEAGGQVQYTSQSSETKDRNGLADRLVETLLNSIVELEARINELEARINKMSTLTRCEEKNPVALKYLKHTFTWTRDSTLSSKLSLNPTR